MRVAMVSPYSYAYPGGVARHVEALAEQLLAHGHEARILAPHDPDDRLARLLHRGVGPRRQAPPDHLVPLGRTVAVSANGARSNLALAPEAVARLSRELRGGGYDLVHVHEPNAPLVSWCATELARAPLVGTFHAYSTSWRANGLAANVIGARRLYNRLGVRIAVSEAARWTAERYYGGRYRIVPNGVDLAAARRPGPKPHRPGDGLQLLFLGRAEGRKGLAVLVRALDLLRERGIAARLTVAGATKDELAAHSLDAEDFEVAGPVGETEKWQLLHEADLLCAPSVGGESFGMVLTEALASGTPVVCSDIAGYRDVVRDGVEGVLVAPGRSDKLAEALAALARDPARRERMGARARSRARRFAWPRVAREVVTAYGDALALPAPASRLGRAGARIGARPADGRAPRPPRRLASIDPPSPGPEPGPGPRRAPGLGPRCAPARATRRRRALAIAAAVVLLGLGVSLVGGERLGDAVLSAAPLGVLAAAALMTLALLLRAEAWHAIVRAALAAETTPTPEVRRADTARATMVGVLMSATLPARLGELARCVVIAQRLGPVRERLALVAGTVASQALLNLLAVALLGAVVLAGTGIFGGGEGGLAAVTLLPAGGLLALLVAPALAGTPGGAVDRVHTAPGWTGALRRAAARAARGLAGLRRGLAIFAHPRLGPWAAIVQLSAWAVQWLACYGLLVALGLDARAGPGAAAAVLLAVNAAGVLPALPANLGVFQAACVAVLAAYGVHPAEGLAYGVVLQALELAVAVVLGGPALLHTGVSWRAMRSRALSAAASDRPSASPTPTTAARALRPHVQDGARDIRQL